MILPTPPSTPDCQSQHNEKLCESQSEDGSTDSTDILDSYPEFASTEALDKLRETEYAYLDAQDHVYLDYTGAGLAAQAQHRAHADRLSSTLFGNPHSESPTSNAATEAVEDARRRVLEHFNASPKEYVAIFTPNATGAARLVGESYPFRRGNRLVMTADNHNSVNGLREFVKRRHVRTVYISSSGPDLRVDRRDVERALVDDDSSSSCLSLFRSLLPRFRKRSRSGEKGRSGLFAYPAQSNFSGVRHPLEWVNLAQDNGYRVLLDAAAYLPTATLDLSGSVKPDFIIASWYKLFGYPTGLGCLIVRRDALECLRRPWFAGGTVQAVSVRLPEWHVMACNEARYEDGTVNFQAIPDVAVGLDWLKGVGMPIIQTRVRCLTGWFLERLVQLRHSDGRPMVLLYGPQNTKMRGGTVTFNFLDAAGKIVDERLVAKDSTDARISLRTGCFCNPGCGEEAFGLTVSSLSPLRHTRMRSVDDYIRAIGLPSAGAIRVSFGLASNARDVNRFFEWAETAYRDRVTTTDGLTPRGGC